MGCCCPGRNGSRLDIVQENLSAPSSSDVDGWTRADATGKQGSAGPSSPMKKLPDEDKKEKKEKKKAPKERVGKGGDAISETPIKL